MAERMPRDLETREKTARVKAWTPPSALPDPQPQDGWVFRWIRVSLLGTADATNVSSRMREGWEPVRAEEHPELLLSMGGTNKAGHVEVGGLILCKAPAEFMQQREKYYADQTKAQLAAVNSNYMRENDPRMPVFSENKTEVRFGSGTK
jgi:hypothetical protein